MGNIRNNYFASGHHGDEGGLCVPHQELPRRHRRRGGPQEPRQGPPHQEEEAAHAEWAALVNHDATMQLFKCLRFNLYNSVLSPYIYTL